MPMDLKKRVIGFSAEATPGTAETLDATDFNFKAFNISMKLDIEQIERNYADGHFGEWSNLIGKKMGTVSFSVHIAEATVSGDVPNYGKILQACGLTQTDNGANITYDLVDTNNFVSATIEVVDFNEGASPIQKVWKFKGCMGKVKFVCNGVGSPIEAQFEFSGAYLGCTDRAFASLLVPDAFETSKAPTFLNGTATYAGTALFLDKWTLDLGIELSPVVDPADATGVQGYHMVGFKPRFTADPLSKIEATDGLEAAYQGGTAAALALTLGSTITFAAPKLNITKVDVADRGGMVVKNIEGMLLRTVADSAVETGYPFTLTIA